ncbi:hypothetical protein AYK24_03205 [Thermoplasmatales archaeon SG8-52-4]|nr:MAG: hypothetical protein AYK24_03205 [Thermoplasmatales archaeon SG8-52-4]
MLSIDKDKKIKEKIQEITGIEHDFQKPNDDDFIKHFRLYTIKKILIISSSDDYKILEKNGQLNDLLREWCLVNLRDNPPLIMHYEKNIESFNINYDNFDIIIIFDTKLNPFINEFSENIKKFKQIPVILLASNINESSNVRENNYPHIDKVFYWNDDSRVIISIIKYFEDLKNIEKSNSKDFKKCILLIDSSIRYYSDHFLIINEEIYSYLKNIIDDELNFEQKILRIRRRPFLLHADDFNKGLNLFEKYKDDLVCVIIDKYLYGQDIKKPSGIEIAEKIIKYNPNLPILILSSDTLKNERIFNKNVKIFSKNSDSKIKFDNFIKDSLGFTEFILKDEKTEKIFKIKNIGNLENAIDSLDNKVIFKNAKQNIFSTWLKNIGEIEFSNKFLSVENSENDEENLKKQLKNLIEEYHYSLKLESISKFSRKSEDLIIKISRIGDGALGGKARGLAFIGNLISKYKIDEMFPDLKVNLPRSIILSTDIFDMFIKQNNLNVLDFNNLSDERIAAIFMEKSLPAIVLGDLRSFIKNTRKPIIVRSSGLLEDSLMHPFAGIYESVLFPNESWEDNTRFQEICNSIKYVFASTFFEKARTYIKNTSKKVGDEKMAIIIQEVVGERHDEYFYPSISGVAKSYNYYPSGPCKPEEGIVYLAVGLGKSIVDGGSSFAFCPEKPAAPLFGTPLEYMKYAQTKFYALNLKSIYKFSNFNEEISLEKLSIDITKKYGILDKIVSTYIPQDEKLYPGLSEDGYVIVDFAPILNLNSIPLVKTINLLLKISEIALDCPVEIEFALNLPKEKSKPAELYILQIRNMIAQDKKIEINIEQIPKDMTIFYSENSLGNRIIEDIKDIIYVDQDVFDLSNSNQVVNQIKNFNNKLMDEKKPYILVGPGRWGSTDPWLGIPVIWSDIAGAKVIVETPYKERHIDPSQGSHFFHDMIASQVVYLIIKKENDIDWSWIKKQKILERTEFIKHIKTINPLKTIVDGLIGKGIIVEQDSKI